MIKPLVQPQKKQDGYSPPFTMIDETVGKRLEYGEQIEPLDEQPASIIQRIQREVDKATPQQMKEWTRRYEELGRSIAAPMTVCNDG